MVRPLDAKIASFKGQSLLGPFDIARARRLSDESLYAARIIRDRSDRWVLLAFRNTDEAGRFVGEIVDPIPLSRTEIRITARSASRCTHCAEMTTFPAAVNFTALLTRLRTIWRMRPGSPNSAFGRSGSISETSANPLSEARIAIMLFALSRTASGENGRVSNCSRPASSLDRSRMSLRMFRRPSLASWIASADYTRVWTPTLVMDLNMGFFRNAVFRNPPSLGMNVAQQLGVASLPIDQTPQLTTNGYNNIGADTNTDQVNITNTFTPFGTVTKTFGPHTLKFGASLRKNQFNSFNPSGSPNGSLNFDGSITNHGASGNPTTGFADFLLGKIKTGNYQLPMPETGRRNFNVGIFAQNDWKATSRLTMNAGLRYEYESPMKVASNIYTRFDPNVGQFVSKGENLRSFCVVIIDKNYRDKWIN